MATDLPGGRLFISDSSNNRIVVTDLKGNFIEQVGCTVTVQLLLRWLCIELASPFCFHALGQIAREGEGGCPCCTYETSWLSFKIPIPLHHHSVCPADWLRRRRPG